MRLERVAVTTPQEQAGQNPNLKLHRLLAEDINYWENT
jgi:hypothetical protein